MNRTSAYMTIKRLRLALLSSFKRTRLPKIFGTHHGHHGHNSQGRWRDPHIRPRRHMSPRCISPSPYGHRILLKLTTTTGPLACPPADAPFASSHNTRIHIFMLHHDPACFVNRIVQPDAGQAEAILRFYSIRFEPMLCDEVVEMEEQGHAHSLQNAELL
ncbi:hypothetical protein BC827DRAFT_134351 [Russula dissimulans]|nr:hypothetical protein BC827DRAFT_134351 [Russula dissimulans]